MFQHVEGVRNAVSGYAGGAAGTARYRDGRQRPDRARRGGRGDLRPAEISYGEILHIFFSVAHDPTAARPAGAGCRAAVPLGDLSARRRAGADREGLHRAARRDRTSTTSPIVTTIEPGRAFYPAEDYHQDYLTRNPTQPYIVHNDLPKIEHLKRLFPQVWRDDPVLVSEAARSGA